MKRHGNLFDKICHIDNIILAYERAKIGKKHYREVKLFEANKEKLFLDIQHTLQSGEYRTSEYRIKSIHYRGKEREIHILPFYPDRVVHHAVMNILAPIFDKLFIRDTFQSIHGRGCLDAKKRITKFTSENKEYTHYIKFDIKKYYPSVDNNLLKQKIRRKIKCRDTLMVVSEIIDSCSGLPIGNYTSQYFGNFYLTDMDNAFKHKMKVKGYFRYCDDIVVFCKKEDIKGLLQEVDTQIKSHRVALKKNPTVNTIKHGLNFCGWIFKPNRVILRKTIASNFLQSCKSHKYKSIPSYYGWCIHSSSHSLWRVGMRTLNFKSWRTAT